MPALRLLGRKWSAATDDLVFPGLFELSFRILWLGLTIAALVRYYPATWYDCTRGGDLVRAYLVAQTVLLGVVVIVTILLVNRSAQGAVMDTSKRRHVPTLLLIKVGLVVPEVALNCLGTAWTFGSSDITGIECTRTESFSKTVVEALVIFDWVLFGLTVFGLAMVFDPMGSRRYQDPQATPGESLRHRKTTSLWTRRLRWLFCWMRSDEYGHEAFEQVAGLLSALFRSTDLVPSDLVAGCVLLRVKQKREVRERRRIQMLTNDEPKFSTDLKRIFSTCPAWMNLRDALHFLRLSMAAYGWPFVLYRYPITGAARLAPRLTCCACFRRKAAEILDDNCCFCHLAGVKYWSKVRQEDVLFASFRNHIFEMPFCVIADHSTRSIVIAVRGSISLRDIFTDLVAVSEPFEAPGLPPGTQAHKGMLHGARFISALLQRHQVLERAFTRYPTYQLVLTGHSLGASVASLLGIMLRGVFPTLRVYSFSCPAGTISREAARLTESFIFTVGVGDDFVMRLGVHSIENLRTSLIQTLHATRLPKYRIVWNGFGYALFGVPSADLETTWKDETEAGNTSGESPLLEEQTAPLQTIAAVTEANILSRDINMRRISKTRLYNSGRILYIVHRKKTKAERKAGTGGPSYELRWAQAEEFLELRVMPRMMLDHFPENVYATINTVLQELGDEPSEI